MGVHGQPASFLTGPATSQLSMLFTEVRPGAGPDACPLVQLR